MASRHTPTAVLTIAGVAQTLVFNVKTLAQVEDRLELSLLQVISKFLGRADIQDDKITPEQAMRAFAENYRVGFALQFVAACTGRDAGALADQIGLEEIRAAAMNCFTALSEASQLLLGESKEGREVNPSDSADSAPGPASSLESAPPSSES